MHLVRLATRGQKVVMDVSKEEEQELWDEVSKSPTYISCFHSNMAHSRTCVCLYLSRTRCVLNIDGYFKGKLRQR